MEQGGEDRHLAFILAGSVSVILNGRHVATRNPGQNVGEMALIETFVKRSATVRATELTAVAEISEHEFNKLAEKHPRLWRRVAHRMGIRCWYVSHQKCIARIAGCVADTFGAKRHPPAGTGLIPQPPDQRLAGVPGLLVP